MEFDRLTNKESVEAWNAIQVIFERTKGEPDVIGMIAAGPLEDLLVQNGEAVINKIENYADKIPPFKHPHSWSIMDTEGTKDWIPEVVE